MMQDSGKRVCGLATEVYSRVVGYHRPIKNWNKGKLAEFKERVAFDLGGGLRKLRTASGAAELGEAAKIGEPVDFGGYKGVMWDAGRTS